MISSDEPKTQKEFVDTYRIARITMNNYMRMASMILELVDLIETGIVIKPFTPKYSPEGDW